MEFSESLIIENTVDFRVQGVAIYRRPGSSYIWRYFKLGVNSSLPNCIIRKTRKRLGNISVMSICRVAFALDLRTASPNTLRAL